jgi:hypothetical protein
MLRPERNAAEQTHRHALTIGRCRRDARPQRPVLKATPFPALIFAISLMNVAFRLARIRGSGCVRDHYLRPASAPADRKLRADAEINHDELGIREPLID